MLLSELAQKELIQVEDGVRYGFLGDSDLVFHKKTGAILGFEIRKKSGKFLFKQRSTSDTEFIPWSEIILIGEHRVLFGKTISMDEVNVDD